MTKSVAIQQAIQESSITCGIENHWKVLYVSFLTGIYEEKHFRKYKNAQRYLTFWRFNRVCVLLGCVADFSNAPKLPKYYRDPRFSIGNLRDRVNQMLKLEEQIK